MITQQEPGSDMSGSRAATKKLTTMPLLVGMLLLFCALAFYYLAVLNIDYSKTALLDLGPYPDAVEYFAQAKAMLKERWPAIQIGYDKLPSRYPPGYPALMLPWLKILSPQHAVLAPFRTNQTIGLVLLLGVFGFYLYLGMPLAGGCATLLLATLPCFFTFCRSSMSEISAATFVVLTFIFTYLGLVEDRRWKIYLSAVFLGLSLNIRTQNIFFAPLLLAIALFPSKGSRLDWFLHCAAVVIVFALAGSPVPVLNTIQFHSPLKSGYDFWIPHFGELLSPRYLPINADELWKRFALSPKPFEVANIFGTGTVFVPAFGALVLVGLCFLRLNRFVICAVLACVSFLTMTTSYKIFDSRFYLPLLIVLVAVAVLPVIWAAKNLLVKKHAAAALAIFVLFATACLGYPSRSGYNPGKVGRSQAWDALHFTVARRQSDRFLAQKHFVDRFGEESGIVLSDIDPAYLNALFPERMIAAPLDERHHYRYSKLWRYDRPQALALVTGGLQQALPIYALFTSMEEINTQRGRLPNVPGYEWVLAETPTADAAILKLTSK
jgi:hypothetical protein